jgi:hypothetical protein
MFFVRHEMRLKNQLIIANCGIKRPGCLHSSTDVAPNLTTHNMLLIIDFKKAYYVENMTILGGAVFRERPELWSIFGFSIVTVFEVTERSVSSSL